MADYSQYGFPPAPPPPPPSHSQHAPSGPDQQQQPFPFPIPGLNMAAYAQNMQQQQYPAWPPMPPFPQQTAYGHPFPPPIHAQNGFPIPPPPLPGFHPHDAIARNHSAPIPAHAQPMRPDQAAFQNERVVDMAESDREEGEVSEGDATAKAPPTGPKRAVVNPPRSVPATSQNAPRNDNRNGYRDKVSKSNQQAPVFDNPAPRPMHGRPSRSQLTPSNALEDLPRKRDAGKTFLKVLHENRVEYPTLAAEDLPLTLLRGLYQEAGLPVQPQPDAAPAPTPRITTGSAPAAVSQHTAAVSVAPTAKADGQGASKSPSLAVSTKAVPSPGVKAVPSPINREDYIARLQAAKLAKQTSTSKAPQKEPPKPPAALTTAVPLRPAQDRQPAGVPPSATKTPQHATVTGTVTATAKTPTANAPKEKSAEEKARQTELIKQRLALLKVTKFSGSQSTTPQPPESSSTVPASNQVQPPSMAKDDAPPQSNQESSFSKIPGLFMNSTAAPTPSGLPPRPPPVSTQNASSPSSPARLPSTLPVKPPSASIPNGNGVASRKRPVASDFDNVGASSRKRPAASDFGNVTTTYSPGPAYTRPLGESPHEYGVEPMIIEVSDDESGGSDMDLDEDRAGVPPSSSSVPQTMRNGIHNLRNFPLSADPPSRPGSAVQTPPAGLPPTEKELKMQERIAALKKKIALKEQEKRSVASAEETISRAPAAQAPQLIAELKHAEHPSTPSSDSVPQILATNSIAQSNEDVINSDGTAGQLPRELKRRTLIELQAALRSLDTGLGDESARLAQLEKERAEILAKQERYMRDREDLLRELEGYDIQTDGMANDELQAEKDKIDSQKDLEQTTLQSLPDVQPPETARPEPQMAPNTVPTAAKSPVADVTSAPTELVVAHVTPSSVVEHKEATFPALAKTGASVATPTTGQATGSATPAVEDDEDFYSPEPVAAPVPDEPHEAEQPSIAGEARQLSEEGEVEMSESSTEDEEEYVPEEPQDPALVSAPDNDMEDVRSRASSTSATSMSTTEDEGEIYEPPEHDQITPAPHTGSVEQREEADDQSGMDVSMSSSDESDSAQESSSDAAPNLSLSNHPSDSVVVISDDLAPELQPQVSPAEARNEEQTLETEAEVDRTRFMPYESPLRMFKSYRYHPSYSQDVAGGYLSPTYSHQIDPLKPLCRFECTGGTCNDPHCKDQHFRDMNISADKLLVELGTANPGQTPNAKAQYNEGLRQVLKDIRLRNIDKDPTEIVREIVKYRRQFLNDDSKVVNLGPTKS